MNTIIRKLLLSGILISITISSYAQQISRSIITKIEPYSIAVTYFKTTHLLFPSPIRYVDLGSEYLIAGKAEDAKNVLRVKASVLNFTGETNFSVITDDGRFYNFNVHYNTNPTILNYNLQNERKVTEIQPKNDVLFEELGNSAPSITDFIMESIHNKNRRTIRHIGSKSDGIQFLLKGIYVCNGKFYFYTQLRNKSNVPFQIDFVNFKIVDKKVAKRTVVQEKPLTPLRMYKPLAAVANNSVEQNVFMLDQFTISDDKMLVIEIFEKNGGRQQALQVENSDLIHAKQIKSKQLNLN